MTHKNEKGLKPWLFKSVAVFIGICYLMVPLQHEVTELMHFLSHSFDQVSSHHAVAFHTHNLRNHAQQHKTNAGKSSKSTLAHLHTEEDPLGSNDHHHPHQSSMHQHEIINFMTMAFSTPTSNQDDNEKIPVQFNLDKHLVIATYIHLKAVQIFKKTYFSNLKKNTSKGIQHPMVPPPKPLC